jgi:hypothetical protein
MSTEASASLVREELERILASTAFRGAGQSARLLRYVVEETLAGRPDKLKDYSLGAEALGRGANWILLPASRRPGFVHAWRFIMRRRAVQTLS